MDVLIKCSALAFCGCAVCLLIKRHNPELALMLGAAITVTILLAAMKTGESVKTLSSTVKAMIGTANTEIAPVFKCVAIAAVTKISSELFKESNQSALSAAIELAGTMCAIGVAMPVVISMLELIGGMI